MALRLLGYIELPAHRSSGGFDHADIYAPTDRLYVAHTGNDAVDVIDIAGDKYIKLMPGFTAVAGALVSEGAASYSRPTEVKTLSRCLRQVPSGRRSKSGWA